MPAYPGTSGIRVDRDACKRGSDVSTSSSDDGNTTAEEGQFVCAECRQEITVNTAMREAILDNGCPVCGAPATVDAFEP